MCVGGIEEKDSSHAKKVCASALDMLKFVEGLNLQYEALGRCGVILIWTYIG